MKVTAAQLASLKAYYVNIPEVAEPNRRLICSLVDELVELRFMVDQDADGNWNENEVEEALS